MAGLFYCTRVLILCCHCCALISHTPVALACCTSTSCLFFTALMYDASDMHTYAILIRFCCIFSLSSLPMLPHSLFLFLFLSLPCSRSSRLVWHQALLPTLIVPYRFHLDVDPTQSPSFQHYVTPSNNRPHRLFQLYRQVSTAHLFTLALLIYRSWSLSVASPSVLRVFLPTHLPRIAAKSHYHACIYSPSHIHAYSSYSQNYFITNFTFTVTNHNHQPLAFSHK